MTYSSSTSETGQARSWKQTVLIEECWISTEVKPCGLEMHARINTIQGRIARDPHMLPVQSNGPCNFVDGSPCRWKSENKHAVKQCADHCVKQTWKKIMDHHLHGLSHAVPVDFTTSKLAPTMGLQKHICGLVQQIWHGFHDLKVGTKHGSTEQAWLRSLASKKAWT